MSLVHTQIGTGHLKSKKFPQAFREFFTAVELDKKNALAHNQLGLTYILSDHLQEAETHLLKAIELAPKYTDAKVNYAYLLIEQKKYRSAIDMLKEAGKDLTYQNQYKILTHLGRAQFYLEEYKPAELNLKTAILKNRKYCPAHRFFGPSLVMLKQVNRSIKAIEHAISICKDEDYPELYYYGALAYYHASNWLKAEAKLNELKSKFPANKFTDEANKLQNIIESLK